METYFARVKMPNGAIVTVPVVARNPGQVPSLIEAQYGAGTFRGVLQS